MPTGISVGANKVLPIKSAITTSVEPIIAATGRSFLMDDPTKVREICGTIRPTKPRSPAKLTAEAAHALAIITHMIRSALTFIPSAAAAPSPRASVSMRGLSRRANKNDTRI